MSDRRLIGEFKVDSDLADPPKSIINYLFNYLLVTDEEPSAVVRLIIYLFLASFMSSRRSTNEKWLMIR